MTKMYNGWGVTDILLVVSFIIGVLIIITGVEAMRAQHMPNHLYLLLLCIIFVSSLIVYFSEQ